jgi:hypothetical protein
VDWLAAGVNKRSDAKRLRLAFASEVNEAASQDKAACREQP